MYVRHSNFKSVLLLSGVPIQERSQYCIMLWCMCIIFCPQVCYSGISDSDKGWRPADTQGQVEGSPAPLYCVSKLYSCSTICAVL